MNPNLSLFIYFRILAFFSIWFFQLKRLQYWIWSIGNSDNEQVLNLMYQSGSESDSDSNTHTDSYRRDESNELCHRDKQLPALKFTD